MKTIDRTELERWTNEQREFALVDVLPDSSASTLAVDLPHAHSRSDFLRQVEQLKAHKEQPVVLYEASSASVHSGAAADMLEHAGFGNVYHFVGPQASLHAEEHSPSPQSQSESA